MRNTARLAAANDATVATGGVALAESSFEQAIARIEGIENEPERRSAAWALLRSLPPLRTGWPADARFRRDELYDDEPIE